MIPKKYANLNYLLVYSKLSILYYFYSFSKLFVNLFNKLGINDWLYPHIINIKYIIYSLLLKSIFANTNPDLTIITPIIETIIDTAIFFIDSITSI